MSRSLAERQPPLYAPDWNNIPALEIIETARLDSQTVLLKTTGGDLKLCVYDSGVRISSSEQRSYDYGLVLAEPEKNSLLLSGDEQISEIRGRYVSIRIHHRPMSFELRNASGNLILSSATDGHFVRQHRVTPFAKTSEGWLLSMALDSGEPVYGLGEKWGALNKRGQLVRSYNQDALGVNAEASYKNTPFAWSPAGWGVFVHTPAPVTHAIGYAPWSQRSYCIQVEDEELDVFLLASAAENMAADLIKSYTNLTGRAPIPPRWSGGVILSKAYYQDADEILAVAREVRERNMPCDVITFDGRAWQDTETRFAFEWCPERYLDPEKVLRQLKDLNFKICVWEYPLISIKHPWFKEFSEKAWLLKDKRTGEAYEYEWDQQAFGEVLTPLPKSGIVDFTHPDAYAFWRDAHKALFEMGVDMIKADFGEQVEDENMLAHNGENGQALHNVYAFLYNRCVYEAAEKFSTSGPFLFSRAAWTGSQRFNSQWGGDPQADWEGMMGNIRGGISWGLSGAPFYATDVGGFYKDTRNDQLYVRWAQAGIFSAHFRLHGIGPREPWSYSDEANKAVSKALQLRYRLQAYLQQSFKQANKTGLPVQRAMVLAFPEEKQAWAFENQFMFGDDLLVVPCFNPQGRVEFYLPEGEWVLFDPDSDSKLKTLQGARVHTMELELDQMAVFARKTAKIPLNEVVQFTEQFGNEIKIVEYWSVESL